jgi:uncharacterized damage-inducible protein DinB
MIRVPKAEELTPYYQSYLKYIPVDADLLSLIKEQANATQQFLASIPKEKESFAYAGGKWMLKEVVGHLCDTERILAYRALCFARNDKTPLAGFDENSYTPNSNYSSRSLKNIAEELATVRTASISLFSNMSDEMFERTGTANNNSYTARQMLFFIAGHEKHHLAVINERYLLNN